MSSAANHRKRSHRSEGRTASAVGKMNARKAIKPSATSLIGFSIVLLKSL